jgi:protein TonB
VKRLASAATVAVGLHLLLFSLEIDRGEKRHFAHPQPDAVTIDLMAAPPRVERPDPPSPPPPQRRSDRVAGYRELPTTSNPPAAAKAVPGKAPRRPLKKPPAAPAPSEPEPTAAATAPARPQEEALSEIPRMDAPLEDGRFLMPQPASPRPSAGGQAPVGARQPSAPVLQAATPDYDRNPSPEYPRRARQLGFEGTVLLQVWVNSAGGVDDAKIATSSGYALLDDSALRAVKGWLFKPARRGDQPVAAWVQVPVRFTLAPPAADIP